MSLYGQIIDMLGGLIPHRKNNHTELVNDGMLIEKESGTGEKTPLKAPEFIKAITLFGLASANSTAFHPPETISPGVGYEVKIISRENKGSIIICDIDGVLADEHVRREKYLTHTKDYDGYYSDVSNDTHIPILWDFLKGKNVAFFTGRRESCRKQTLQWLDRRPYLKLDPKLLFMRPEGDLSHAKLLKYRFLHVLLSWGYKVDLAIDDNKDICRMYNFHDIPTLHCRFYDLDLDN